MPTIYPNGIDNTSTLPVAVDNVTHIVADVVNQNRSAVIAIEAELGVNPSGTYATVKDRLDAIISISSGDGYIRVQQAGSTVSTSNFLNFQTGATVTDVGGVATIAIVGGTGGGTLSDTLALGNTTGANNVVVTNSSIITNYNCDLALESSDGYNITVETSGNLDLTATSNTTSGNITLTAGGASATVLGSQIILESSGSVDGGYAYLYGGDGENSGGLVTIEAGDSSAGNGGGLYFTCGSGVSGGVADILAGAGTSGDGGGVNIRGGASGTALGGEIDIRAGASSLVDPAASGGDINIASGAGYTNGNIYFKSDGYTGIVKSNSLKLKVQDTIDGYANVNLNGYSIDGYSLPSIFSGAQGSVLYRGASSWTSLSPGTDGYVLTTHGAGANPTWTEVVGGSFPSGVQGNVLYHNGSTWAALDTGTDGYVLTTHGAGADPTWAASSGGSLPSGVQGNILYNNGTSWVTLETSTDGYVLTTHGAGANPTWTTPGLTDHGLLSGLEDDDHSQYLLVSGTRNMTGNLSFTNTLANPTITQAARTSGAASSFTIKGQNNSTSNESGGSVYIVPGNKTGTGTGSDGYVYIKGPDGYDKISVYNNQVYFNQCNGYLGYYSAGNGALWMGSGAGPLIAGSYAVVSSGTSTDFNGLTQCQLTVAGTTRVIATANRVTVSAPLGFAFHENSPGTFTHSQKTADTTPDSLTITAQSAYASATGISRNAGGIILKPGKAAVGGTDGYIYLQNCDGANKLFVSNDLSTFYTNVSLNGNTIDGYNLPSILSGAQGSVLYRGASSWTSLSPGTDGYVLTTHGAGANPTWAASSGSSLPSGVQGNVLYHNGTSWTTLATSTAGSVLTTQGPAANPTWEPAGSLPSGTLGSLVYHNGTNWVEFGGGTDGYVLTTHSTVSAPTWDKNPVIGYDRILLVNDGYSDLGGGRTPTLTDGYDFVAVYGLTENVTINLPTTPITGKRYTIKDSDASCILYTITVSGNGYNIEGTSTFVMNTLYQAVNFTFIGSKWSAT